MHAEGRTRPVRLIRAALIPLRHGPCACPVRAEGTSMPLLHGSCTRPVFADERARPSYTVRALDPCSLYPRVDQASHGPCCFPLAALHTHELLLSSRAQMMLPKNSFPTTSAQNLPSKACLRAHRSLLSSYGSISSSQSSDPQLITLHRTQPLNSNLNLGDFN